MTRRQGDSALHRWVARAVPVAPAELGALLWSFAYFFLLLAGYYVLRPLRDQMGIAGGVRNLPWMFTATFAALLAAQPLYGALVARLPRARFIPFVYHFFVANLALFWLLLALHVATVWVARAFFVWVSVFNLFAVTVFWSFMADLFTSEQGKRLFGEVQGEEPDRRRDVPRLRRALLRMLRCGTDSRVSPRRSACAPSGACAWRAMCMNSLFANLDLE